MVVGSKHFGPPARVEQDDTLWTLWQGVDWQIYRFRESFSSAEELRRCLAKFNPEFQPRYLASEGGLHLPDTLMAVAALISRRTASSV